MIVVFTCLGIPVPGLEAGKHRLELAEGSSLRAFVGLLAQHYPSISKAYLAKSTIFVNQLNADLNQILLDGDEILLLTVLGGG